jgi:hypothetical protein
VDAQPIGPTGLSRGWVISWLPGAADERLKRLVPACQTGSIEHLVIERHTAATYGEGATAPLAIYAALLDAGIMEVILKDPPESHEDPDTPEFLGVLQIGDLPQNLALLWPRPATFVGDVPPA